MIPPHAVLITGGARGLGAAMALACAGAGMDVAIQYCTDGPDVAATVAAIRARGVRTTTIATNLADPAQVLGVVADATKALGRPLTALVNSASIITWDDITTLTAERMLAHYLPNAVAPALLAQSLLTQLPDGVTGAIVNILDQDMANQHGDRMSYILSQYAFVGLGEMLARAGAPRLRVNAIAIGSMPAVSEEAQTGLKQKQARNPLGLVSGADHVAKACVHLLESPVITGQTLHLDAGLRFAGLNRDISFY